VELVVVDDGSTDMATHRVLSDLEGSGIRVIRQHNQGQSAATSTGMAATSAPYLMRFDSDDLLEPGAIHQLADALDDVPEAAVAWGDFHTFGLTTFAVPGAPVLDPWLLTHVNLLPGSGVLIRRAALIETGAWSLNDGFEDWDLWMSFAERGYRGIYIAHTVFRYRRGTSSRQAKERSSTAARYEDLLSRHPTLVQARQANCRRSRAPLGLKILVRTVDALPLVPRLTKINACEFLARLLWSGTPWGAVEMLRQGLALRRSEWRQSVISRLP
jgi:glycosyltransferase involved in cell wall biosynthesis